MARAMHAARIIKRDYPVPSEGANGAPLKTLHEIDKLKRVGKAPTLISAAHLLSASPGSAILAGLSHFPTGSPQWGRGDAPS